MKKCLVCKNECRISNFRLYKQLKRKDSRITEIVLNLIDNNKFIVHGYWLCREWKCQHEPRCYNDSACLDIWLRKHKWQCKHEPFKCSFRKTCRSLECKCRYNRFRQHEWKCQNIWIKQNEWQCRHDQKCKTERKCRQQEFQCPNEWQSTEYTQELLKDYLEKTPQEQDDFFIERCEKCKKKCLISSFRLYLQQPKSLEVS
ncbi:hypothetical protein C1645_186653 [Glomus cerebriforme]|uniref:Uncharacterized protein n=1 Tax=Glomus cerebriforme TaxID=658196 RepID=A0A397T3C5_9GLOM|nr:hypothetical protein C1645_186653 [Glomus cerebriforme]